VAAAVALPVYGVLLAVAAAAVWRRPIVALYCFLIGLPLHNLVLALLYDAGVRDAELDAIAAWKEVLLATAAARVAVEALRERRLPFRPGLVDGLALGFAGIVVLYAVIPQNALGGAADAEAIAHGVRHGLVPVVAFLLGRSLGITAGQLNRLAWTTLGVAAVLAVEGLIEEYAVSVEWWRGSGAVGYFRDHLGFEYHGPGGLPENFAFNTTDGLFRRLISTFISPLATGYLLVVALLVAPARKAAIPLAAVSAVGLLFTVSRSALLGLAVGFLLLAIVRRRLWPVGAAVAAIVVGVGFAALFTEIAPRTHWFPEDIAYQEQQARERGGLPDAGPTALNPGEPSLRSHLTSLRDGLETVARHPQGYGLGNAGATAARFDVALKAGESNYTEIGVETGVAGMILFIAWSLALLVGLVRSARRPDAPPATAGLAAAFAAVLLVAIQTDAYGVPWLAYCLWWLSGAVLEPAALPTRAPAPARAPTAELA
jgi:hypothetical protein